ncbi:MAG TPA: hypothetical protein VJO16_02645 [Candidatus Acidoferrum sp.]|nr:hypothetical protein [Candidatus Acidoferrum sp.]
MDECGDGTVIWLKRAAIDATAETQQRICIDALTESAIVYWTNAQGKLNFKTFRTVAALREWMSNNIIVEHPNTVVPGSSSLDGLQSRPEISIAAGAGKRAS